MEPLDLRGGTKAESKSNKDNNFQSKVNSLNTGCVTNMGYRPLYTMMSHLAAFGRITRGEAALQPFVPF